MKHILYARTSLTTFHALLSAPNATKSVSVGICHVDYHERQRNVENATHTAFSLELVELDSRTGLEVYGQSTRIQSIVVLLHTFFVNPC